MDLTAQPTLYITYELDPDTNILTMYIKDESNFSLGTIVIENSKYKSLMQAMALMAEERVTTLMAQTGYRNFYNVQDNTAEIVFG